MSDAAFEQYARQIDFMQAFQLEILRNKIEAALTKIQHAAANRDADLALFEHFSGLGEGLDADKEKQMYYEERYGSPD